jgi:hypothetical protein
MRQTAYTPGPLPANDFQLRRELALPQGRAPMVTDTTRDTRAVLDHHIQALGEGFDALLSDYAEDAVVFTPNGPVHGPVAIRAFFEAFFASLPPDLLPALKIIRQDVDGEIAYQNWTAEPYVPLGTDTFVVRDGQIKVQTWSAYMRS